MSSVNVCSNKKKVARELTHLPIKSKQRPSITLNENNWFQTMRRLVLEQMVDQCFDSQFKEQKQTQINRQIRF